MKICKTCNIEKPLNEYGRHSTVHGYRHICRKCSQEKRKQIVRPPCTLTEYTCDTCNTTKSIDKFHKNSSTPQGIVHTCKECRKNRSRKQYLKHSDKIKKRVIKYYQERRPEIRVRRRAYAKKRLATDVLHCLKRRLRNRLYHALKCKEWKKNTHFSEYIGCDRDTLISHIESKFQEGMNWDNIKKWELDHIIPLSSANTEEELYKLSHYSNIQPLWESDNRTKRDSLNYEVKAIDIKDTHDYILNIHYAKRIPKIVYAFGLFLNDILVGIVTYGRPSSPKITKSLIGLENKDKVYELNRLCLKYNKPNEASMLVGRSLKLLPKGLIILSFADSAQDHVGYVYQATNFKYYGTTPEKNEIALKSQPNRHSMSIYDTSKGRPNRIGYLKELYGNDLYYRKRSKKHRYIYVTGKDKSIFKEIKYKEESYPK